MPISAFSRLTESEGIPEASELCFKLATGLEACENVPQCAPRLVLQKNIEIVRQLKVVLGSRPESIVTLPNCRISSENQ
jgi:hypothetical protein